MNSKKSFSVFGEEVDILTSSETTEKQSCLMTQVSPPGGGPPPHSHQNEDETFFVLEGKYELLVDGVSHQLTVGQALHAMRGSVHTFRNVGTTLGKMLISVVPGGLERYLEEVSKFSIPNDMHQLVNISKQFGITYH